MNRLPHPCLSSYSARQGRSNRFLTAVAVLVGGAAGLLLIPVTLGVIALAALSYGLQRTLNWVLGDTTPVATAGGEPASKI
ncbi:MAG: hypothetical protein AAGA23_17995 [Pseudomonadota bacterium]